LKANNLGIELLNGIWLNDRVSLLVSENGSLTCQSGKGYAEMDKEVKEITIQRAKHNPWLTNPIKGII
jgi:hypothetical protein